MRRADAMNAAALLAGKVALVTGGTSGIGRATCLALAREGARVAVVDRNLEPARDTARAIIAAGGAAIALRADVARAEDVATMVEHVRATWGRLDCCVNNAGIGNTEIHSKNKPLAEIEPADFERMLAVNLTGVFLYMKYQLPALIESRGAMVNMGSIASLGALPGAAAYVAAKHGVLGLTRSAAIEYGPQGVRVNLVCPGHLHTPIRGAVDPVADGIATRVPLRRHSTPEEIAELVVWLCSERAAYVNGAAYTADGGRLAAA